jgi:hypothetical protein
VRKQNGTSYLETGDEETIRKSAYFRWAEAGGPASDGIEFWLKAEREQAAALRDALVAACTRLLILQVPRTQFDDAVRLAEFLVLGGCPAVLTAAGRDSGTLDVYFLNLYANIVHNKSLWQVAQPESWMEEEQGGLMVQLVHGQGAFDLLQFNRWLDALRERSTRAREKAERWNDSMGRLLATARQLLHRSQLSAIQQRVKPVADLTSRISNLASTLEGSLDWAHEGGGAEPLSQIAEALPSVEAEALELNKLYPQLKAELDDEVSMQTARAPRVLNANFADPKTQRMLEARSGLIPGEFYDLLVDVGPRWSKVQSIVIGRADFPEDALPVDKEGYVVQVVVVSEDFSPHLVSAEIWVPRRTGRSFPYINGNRAEGSGPVALRLRAPELPGDSNATTFPVHARLCLYYENNLLQSAAVKVHYLPIGHKNSSCALGLEPVYGRLFVESV